MENEFEQRVLMLMLTEHRQTGSKQSGIKSGSVWSICLHQGYIINQFGYFLFAQYLQTQFTPLCNLTISLPWI